MNILWRAETCFLGTGFVTDANSYVIETAPILQVFLGKHVWELRRWLKKKGGSIKIVGFEEDSHEN